MTDERKIYTFLAGSRNTTAREISNGSGASLEQTTAILSVLVSAGEVTAEGSMNFTRYSLASPVPVVAQSAPEKYVSTEQKWSDEQRARVLEAEKANWDRLSEAVTMILRTVE